eukprot:CAMPEP_0172321238 /NCGR_PEP_ID=MMETSP1058-20130122/42782_1 /TAXON_ID=83371 /ORGANISM="Detonula confervacea, Strain CCMP 353" /LENGTH=361 /DNA_ID=CAMNT_0013036687 /DNA_START=173 /DNA_END=1258 /DNA_ORIENTATION=+
MRAPGDRANDEINTGFGSKLSLILLLALITFVSIARNAKSYFLPTSDTNRGVSNDGNRAYAPLIASLYNASSQISPELPKNQQSVSKKSLPIYLLQSSTNQTERIPWGTLTKKWNRTAQYEDLFSQAATISSLPSPTTTASPFKRPVVMIHCGPKTGSTTLRTACKFNLEKTCGVPHKTNGHYPVGYMNEEKLFPLIRQCTKTSHFCAKEVIMPTDIPAFENVMFIHMFPFRNYNEWAKSAMKQQYDRGRETGCDKTKSLLEKCKPSKMEIDFRKYHKTELSKFKEEVVQRMNNKNEHHIFLLYHHRELNDVLKKLSDVYGIPLLPGSDGKGKDARPAGTCDAELLQMFHDCFSSELMELT